MNPSPLLFPLALFSATFAVSGCSRRTTAATPVAASAEAAAAATPPTAPRMAQFKFATQTLSVPEGFTIELVAGPPGVNRPISIAFDEEGRLYVTDSSGLSERADKQMELK